MLNRSAILLSLLAVPMSASACLMPDGSNDADYRALGNQLQASHQNQILWVQRHFAGYAPDYFSAVRINDQYAITAAHGIKSGPFNAVIDAVGTGSSYLTDHGETRTITDVKLYPGFRGDNDFYDPDIAVLKFDRPLRGVDPTITHASVGDLITSGGFGRPVTPSKLNIPWDGYVRGWNAPITIPEVVRNSSSKYYIQTDFGFDPHIDMSGRASNGDSGGAEFNAAGQLVGLTMYGSLPLNTSPGWTGFLKLDNPEVKSWIQANTATPEPTTLLALSLGALSLLKKRKRSQ